VARKRGEANFVGAFQREFTSDRKGQGVGGRHFELAGYGIADFVWMDYGQGADGAATEPVLTSFEMKMKDWRRALSQAYRYSYFADRSIVVVPTDVADRAQGHLHIFERLGIGLWSYDPKAEYIEMRFTPTETKAKSPAAREKAIKRISRKVELRQGRK
jgi:hypothetical protein